MTDLTVDALAVYRIWRLTAVDEVLAPARARLYEHLFAQDRNRLVYFLGCPWCLGAWLCLAALLCRRYLPPVWSVIRTVAATSALVGLIAQLEERISTPPE